MMIVRMMQDVSAKETEIIIKYSEMNKDVERITAILQSVNTRIVCTSGGVEKLVSVSDIYYFESVDKMTFAYCERDVYKTSLRLYQIAEDFSRLGFVQISKSCILNINVLESVAPLINSRLEASLKNNERLFVTRKYLDNIKQALRERV